MTLTINNKKYTLPDELGNIEAIGKFQKYLDDLEKGKISLEQVLKEIEIYKKTVVALPSPTYQEWRAKEYLAKGLTPDKLIVALWEKVVENRPEEADKIQVERVAIKEQIPKK